MRTFTHCHFCLCLLPEAENCKGSEIALHTGDLFDMLLPMLTIYQEYVRNHHYSLQVLTECKQAQPFATLLTRLESKPACQARSLETFLTYPMHQVRYMLVVEEISVPILNA